MFRKGYARYLQGTILAVRRIIAYIVGTLDFQLEAPRVKGTDWHLYSDSDHAGDRAINGTKSVTGVVFLCNGMPIHWRSKKQPTTSTKHQRQVRQQKYMRSLKQ